MVCVRGSTPQEQEPRGPSLGPQAGLLGEGWHGVGSEQESISYPSTPAWSSQYYALSFALLPQTPLAKGHWRAEQGGGLASCDSWHGVREEGEFPGSHSVRCSETQWCLDPWALLLILPGPAVILGSCPACTGQSPCRQPPLLPSTLFDLGAFLFPRGHGASG